MGFPYLVKQAGCQISWQAVPLELPGPVAAGRAGRVHPRLASQPQHVLHRQDGECGPAAEDGVLHGIEHPGRIVDAELPHHLLPDLGRQAGEPARCGVVVMGPGVIDGVGPDVLGLVRVVVMGVEGKLQHRHCRAARTAGAAP